MPISPAELSGIFTISQFDGNLSFRDADLKGRVDFSAACFLGNAIFTRAKFGSGAFFSSVRRNGNILLTRFAGEQLRFYRAEIQGDMEFEGTEFGQQADFEAVRVKGNAIFRAAQFRESGQILAAIAITTFHGGGRFLDATIEGVADFSGAVFAGKSLFNRIKVGGPAFFRNLEDTRHEAVPTFQEASFVGAVFSGGADFDRAHFQGSVSFSEASFGASTRFSRIRCDKQITFDLIEVNGTATFQRSRFEGDVSFQDARISTANFGESSEDKGVFLKSVDLRGFTYVRVIGDWRTLFARISTQDLQPYAQLEKFFRSVGNERDADSVYLARRDVDRKKLRELIRTRSSTGNHLQWQLVRNAFKFAEDSILRWFFNYGVPSYRMVWLACLLFLAGGLTLTTPGALEFSSIPQSFLNAGSITRFLHGIVTFASSLLPHTQEEQITQWRPSHNLLFQKWGPSFKQITLLLSFSVYGCVTLAVASLTGLIKRKQS